MQLPWIGMLLATMRAMVVLMAVQVAPFDVAQASQASRKVVPSPPIATGALAPAAELSSPVRQSSGLPATVQETVAPHGASVSVGKMLVGESSSWFWTMLSSVGLIVSLGLIYKQLRTQVTGNMMQALLAMGDKWDSDHFMAFRYAASTRYQSLELQLDGVDGEALAFLEDVGLFLRKGVFELDVVWERYSYYVENYWWMYRAQILAHRAATNDDTWFSNLEYLYERIARYSRVRHGLDPSKDAEAIRKFAESEIRTYTVHSGRSTQLSLPESSVPSPSPPPPPPPPV